MEQKKDVFSDCYLHIFNALREEIARHSEHGFQRSGTKIAFTTTLLGLASINTSLLAALGIAGSKALDGEPLLYIAPLPAIFYDALLFSDKMSVRRIGQYLKTAYGIPREYSNWEAWVSSNRLPWIANIGEYGFTLITLIYCPLLVWHRYAEKNYLGGLTTANPFSLLTHLGEFVCKLQGWWFILLIAYWLYMQRIWHLAITPDDQMPEVSDSLRVYSKLDSVIYKDRIRRANWRRRFTKILSRIRSNG